MSKYENLDKYLDKKGLKVKEKMKVDKEFKNLSTKEKDELLEKMLRDFGYIE